MRKVIYTMTLSLDGFISSPDGDFEWAAPDETLHRHFNEWEAEHFDTHLYGRKMWLEMASYWPFAEERSDAQEVEREYSRIWKRAEKFVVSNTLESVEGAHLVRGDPAAEVERLKALPGKNISIGGVTLAMSLANRGLVDEFELYYAPYVIRKGRPMFEGLESRLRLRLLETRAFPSGTVMHRYSLAE